MVVMVVDNLGMFVFAVVFNVGAVAVIVFILV